MTSTEKESVEYISEFICAQIKKLVPSAGPLSAETDITTDIVIDSLAIMNLVFTLEEEFDISIPLGSLTDIRTIGDFANLVKKLKN